MIFSRNSVCAPAPVTRSPGTVPGPCFADAHSPRPPPLAPPTPQPVARPCSSASQLLWRGQTSHDRTSSATAPRLSRHGPVHAYACGAGRPRSPGSRARSVRACQVLRPRRVGRALALACPDVLPSATQTASAPEGPDLFRGSMAGLHVPLPTLRRHPRGCLRTARGRCGSLFLHRSGLAPPASHSNRAHLPSPDRLIEMPSGFAPVSPVDSEGNRNRAIAQLMASGPGQWDSRRD